MKIVQVVTIRVRPDLVKAGDLEVLILASALASLILQKL